MEDRFTEAELNGLLTNTELHKLFNQKFDGQYTVGISRIDMKDPSSYCILVRFSGKGSKGVITFSLFGREFDVKFEPGLRYISNQSTMD